MSIGSRCGAAWLTSRRKATIVVGRAITRLTYRHQRQDKSWVSAPPSINPSDAAPPAIAPKIPNAVGRSGDPWKVTVSNPSAERALKRSGGHEHAEGLGQPADRRGHREPDQAGDQGPLEPEQITELSAQ